MYYFMVSSFRTGRVEPVSDFDCVDKASGL